MVSFFVTFLYMHITHLIVPTLPVTLSYLPLSSFPALIGWLHNISCFRFCCCISSFWDNSYLFLSFFPPNIHPTLSCIWNVGSHLVDVPKLKNPNPWKRIFCPSCFCIWILNFSLCLYFWKCHVMNCFLFVFAANTHSQSSAAWANSIAYVWWVTPLLLFTQSSSPVTQSNKRIHIAIPGFSHRTTAIQLGIIFWKITLTPAPKSKSNSNYTNNKSNNSNYGKFHTVNC